jgi:hypothetical protein
MAALGMIRATLKIKSTTGAGMTRLGVQRYDLCGNRPIYKNFDRKTIISGLRPLFYAKKNPLR